MNKTLVPLGVLLVWVGYRNVTPPKRIGITQAAPFGGVGGTKVIEVKRYNLGVVDVVRVWYDFPNVAYPINHYHLKRVEIRRRF